MPRKSTASVAATDANGDVSMVSSAHSEAPTASSPKQLQKEQPQERQFKKKTEGDVTTIDDLLLPRTLINRIARGVLPANTSIQKDAILALSKSATVFISHLAAEANEMTDRKTIQSADVIKALAEIEMAQVMGLGVLGKDGKRGGRVEREVEVWEGNVRGKRRGYRDKVKARESVGGADTTVGSVDIDGEGEGEDEVHENKRRKRDSEEEPTRETDKDMSMALETAGDITNGTNKLKLNAGRRSSGDRANDDEDAEDVEDSADEDEEDQQDEEEEEDQEETRDVEDSVDVEETSRRTNGTLAPDGRIEVGGSDDDDESD
ncbi:hypothetical protein H2198_001209 [Neophaeococcomyces mojaviensis]|uniref:Uncharacterized protein n=1 Tax=Neophaeococcomyces mojaviensis TaxID=3383035 RepID=A0ACC3AI71_9EURO|nr:hypothetical protein H2198_001209 [Knufia sp. JES_112]